MADQNIATASKGLTAQRSRRQLSGQAVPDGALGTAAGPASKGDAGEAGGSAMTVAGRGLIEIRAERYGQG